MLKALITGITGQDGSFLAELLLDKGYEVHGIIRRASTFNTDRIDHLFTAGGGPRSNLYLHHGDLTDGSSLRRILRLADPHEVYNLGAQTHVAVSFKLAEYTAEVDALGTLKLLEAVRDFQDEAGRSVRFYQAGSSEMFGSTAPPQNESTPFHPRSPYAVAKVFAYWQTVNYREAYGLQASNGILFNHESERRGETFVTRKITRAATRIKLGLQETLLLGNLDARRDWGYAADYVRAMWLMLQHPEPDDFVVATGESYTVRDFLSAAFGAVDLDWNDYVRLDERYLRPAEVEALEGDPARARRVLGWEPEVAFDELVTRMIRHDLELAEDELALIRAGRR